MKSKEFDTRSTRGWCYPPGTSIIRGYDISTLFRGYQIVLLSVIVLIGVGCASWQATVDAWKGRKLDDLILSWGPPEKIHEFDDGRKAVLFAHSRAVKATQYYCNVTVNTDPSGIIVSSKVDGNIGGCNRFFRTNKPPE